jgi:hypothetical protein
LIVLNKALSGYKKFDTSKENLLKTYDKTKKLYNTYSVDESEKIRKISYPYKQSTLHVFKKRVYRQ